MIYSYSKLRSFGNCPLQFRFRYLDRIPVEHEGIEAFTGKRVHEVLEALYRALAADPEPPALEALLQLFDAAWERAWHPQVEVVRREATPEDYQRMGKRCLATFYRGNWPFSGDQSLGLEVEMEFDLEREPGAPIQMRGIADRVAANESGELVIHDYKTSTYLPRKEEILADLQLAIYQLGARALWPERRDPKLIWHFLAFGRRVTVRLGGPGIAGQGDGDSPAGGCDRECGRRRTTSRPGRKSVPLVCLSGVLSGLCGAGGSGGARATAAFAGAAPVAERTLKVDSLVGGRLGCVSAGVAPARHPGPAASCGEERRSLPSSLRSGSSVLSNWVPSPLATRFRRPRALRKT